MDKIRSVFLRKFKVMHERICNENFMSQNKIITIMKEVDHWGAFLTYRLRSLLETGIRNGTS